MHERCDVCGTPFRTPPCPRCGGDVARPDLLAPIARRGALAEFATGLDLALRGMGLTLRSPRLLALVIVPFLLTAALFALLVWLVIANRELLRPDFTEPWIRGLDWLRGFAASAAQWLGVVIGIVLACAGTLIGSTVIAAPFLELLSEAVENLVVGQKDQRPLTPAYAWNFWVVPVFQAAGVAAIQGVVGLALLVMSLTGVLAPLTFLGGCWLTAITLCDVAIARKRYPVGARFAQVNAALPLWMGLALPYAFLPLLLPFGVAGATLADLRTRAVARR